MLTVDDLSWYGCIGAHELVAGRLIPFATIKKGPAADTCSGDSGGPLFFKARNDAEKDGRPRYFLAAITSRAVSRIGLNDGNISCGGRWRVRQSGWTSAREWITDVLQKDWAINISR